jgi:hypothetical protein
LYAPLNPLFAVFLHADSSPSSLPARLPACLQLCLPCPGWVSPEYGCLFPADAPDSSTKEGKLGLLGRFKKQLGEWGNLLRRFLRSEDDQVRGYGCFVGFVLAGCSQVLGGKMLCVLHLLLLQQPSLTHSAVVADLTACLPPNAFAG